MTRTHFRQELSQLAADDIVLGGSTGRNIIVGNRVPERCERSSGVGDLEARRQARPRE